MTAYYLKYRPQKVSELDLESVRTGLEKLVNSGKITHAFLFAGPKGTGKTSAARILAKSVNCLKNKGRGEPCNRCQMCAEITSGSSLDLIEIDAASNRGIDDVRDLREKIKLSPARGKYKVYIVDEAHMLTAEAFNALLKTLEEPPEHAIFVLATTAPEKLPQTIISRCMRFNFNRAKRDEVVRALKRAVKGEKLSLEEESLEAIAKSAEGSFRDAHKILEQLALSGKKISLGATQELLGQVEAASPDKLLTALGTGDTRAALSEVNRVAASGIYLGFYSQQLLERARELLLAAIGVGEEVGPIEGLEEVEELQRLIRLFSQATQELKSNPIPQLPLELAVVQFCEAGKKDKRIEDESRQEDRQEVANNPSSSKSNSKLSLEKVAKSWDQVLAGVRPRNHSVEALLRAARPLEVENGTVTLEVFYNFHLERLRVERLRRIVEEVASEVYGVPVKLKCVLGQRPESSQGEVKMQEVEFSQHENVSASEVDSEIIKAAEDIFGGIVE